MDRSSWDKVVSGAGAVLAVVLIALGAMAIYGRRLRSGQRPRPPGAAAHPVPSGRRDDAGGAGRGR